YRLKRDLRFRRTILPRFPPAALLLLRRGAEHQRHIDGVGLLIDVQQRLGLAQIIEHAVLAHATKETIRIVATVRSAFLQTPHFADRGLRLDVQTFDSQLAEQVARAGLDVNRDPYSLLLVVVCAIDFGLRLQVTAMLQRGTDLLN